MKATLVLVVVLAMLAGCSASGTAAREPNADSPSTSEVADVASTTEAGETDAGDQDGAAPVDDPDPSGIAVLDAQPSSTYATLEELYADLMASGVECGALVDDEEPTGSPYEIPIDTPGMQGRCATGAMTAIVFSIYDDADARDARLDSLISTYQTIASPEDPMYLLVGENWFVNIGREQASFDAIREAMGGAPWVLTGTG